MRTTPVRRRRQLEWAAGLSLAVVLAGLQVHAIQRKPSLEASDHPEVVLITARNSQTAQGGKCTGVLIGPRAVLTAAHSVAGFDTWEVKAPYAKHGPAKATAKTAKIHPEYKPAKMDHDLAVLILDDVIDIGRALPTLYGGELYPIETKLIVVGRVSNGTLSQTQLFKTSVTLVPFPGNLNVYGGNPHVVEEGDSGGPIYVHDKDEELAGLVSGNIGFTRSNVRTDLFIPIYRKNKAWILRQVPANGK
jgi:secreted trypsin-like serine protease